MSDLPGQALSYQTVVAEYFLGLRGAGLLLSPLDEELVAEWERRGLPVSVVCRGLRAGLEEAAASRPPGAPLPRSIRALRLSVEDAWRAYQGGRVGDAPAPPTEAAAAAERLEAARALLAAAGASVDGPRRVAYRAAWRALDAAARADAEAGLRASTGPARTDPRGGPAEASPLARVDAALAGADAAMLAAWLAALPRPERAAIGPRLRLRAGPRPRGESRRAHRETLRTHLADLAREAGLTCLRGSV